jgi:hypothetical protein
LAPARNLLHVPLAADIAQTSADLLFGDQSKLRIPADAGNAKAVPARLDGLFHEAAILNELHFGAEVCAAIGRVYLRPMWDTNLADRPLLTVVGADQAIPELRNGILIAVTFWEVSPDARDEVSHDVAANRAPATPQFSMTYRQAEYTLDEPLTVGPMRRKSVKADPYSSPSPTVVEIPATVAMPQARGGAGAESASH